MDITRITISGPFVVIWLLAYILFGLGAAVIAAVGALVFGVLKAFDGAIEKAGKPKANDKE